MTDNEEVKSESTMSQEEVLQLVLKSDSLPSLPTVASKLVSLTAKEDTTLSDVASLISQDIAMSSKILKVANSAFYSFPQQISSIQQAVSMLGTNAVQSLVLSFSFLSINKVSAESNFNFDEFLKRAVTAASVSKLIMGKLSDTDTEEIFVAGLLHKLGELILACTLPEDYNRVLEFMDSEGLERRAAEKRVFGTDGGVAEQAEPHWRLGFCVVSWRTDGAERVAHLFVQHQIDRPDHSPGGPKCCIHAPRRHPCVCVKLVQTLCGLLCNNRIDMRLRMYIGQMRRVDQRRSLTPQIQPLQRVQHMLQPCHPFGVPVRCHMVQTLRMCDQCRRHTRAFLASSFSKYAKIKPVSRAQAYTQHRAPFAGSAAVSDCPRAFDASG